MGNTTWTAAETERLTDLAGDYHLIHLTQHYNTWAACNGFRRRTANAIKHRLYDLGLSCRAEGLWLMAADVARIIGRSPETIHSWIRRGWIPEQHVRQPLPRATMIHRRGLEQLGRERPIVFAGCSLGALLAIFDSEQLAEDVHEQASATRWASQKQPVICLDTRQTYPSVQAAAKANWLTPNSIRYAIQHGTRTAGKRWAKVLPPAATAGASSRQQEAA